MAGTLGRARHALRSGDFRHLLAGRLISQFADGLLQAFLVAKLVFLDPDEQGTALGIAAAYALLVLPFSFIGPFAGVVIDRWSRRRILALTPLVRSASVLLLAAVGAEGWWIFALALVVVSLNRFFLTCAGAVMPSVVADDDLLVGNSMAIVGGTVVTFAGIVAGTKLAEPVGTRGLLLMCAVAWPVAAIAMATIRRPLRPHPGAPASVTDQIRRTVAELAGGFRRLRATPAAQAAIVSVSLDQFLVGFVTVLSVVVFKEQFGEGVASYGNLIAAGGAGVLVGTITVGWFEPRVAKPMVMAIAFGIAGVVLLAAAPWLTQPAILVMAFTLGLTFSWRKVPADTIVQESVPDRFRGRVFSLYDLLYANARVVAAAAAVPLIPRLSTGWLIAVTGALYLAWSPVMPRWVRRRPPVTVGFYAGGKADEVPRTVSIGGEEEPVEVIRSWKEERNGLPLRRFRLRAASGDILEVAGDPGGDRWWLEREVPADLTDGGPGRA